MNFIPVTHSAATTKPTSLLPGQGWMLQSWYSTGDPTQALGLVLPSAVEQLRFRVRKPLEHCWEQLDQVSHDPQRTPWGWDRVRPLVFTKSSTRAGKHFICFVRIQKHLKCTTKRDLFNSCNTVSNSLEQSGEQTDWSNFHSEKSESWSLLIHPAERVNCSKTFFLSSSKEEPQDFIFLLANSADRKPFMKH